MSTPVKVRFPPSPTGFCHVGTARMAILNYLFARKHGGTIYFRSEDTDKERSTPEYEEDIKDQLRWLGLDWDDFSRSSELVERHTAAMQKLIDEDKAYLSEEEAKNEPDAMRTVVRLRNPGTIVAFRDIIRGEIRMDTSDLGDFVIGRAIDDPLYNLAVVVDDAAQGITHVIRGEDHISNTPRQILIQEALGYPRPAYAHYPLHLGADRSKLSKRTGDVAVRSYRQKGYLAPALLNYIAVLGWTPPSGKEVLTLEEMIGEFELEDVHKSGAVFDMEKLRWFNRQYLLQRSSEELRQYLLPPLEAAITARQLPWDAVMGEHILPLITERISVSDDVREAVEAGEYDFFFSDPSPVPSKIPDEKTSAADTIRHLQYARDVLMKLEPFTELAVKDALWNYATEQGRGSVLWPLRYALTGKEKSPDPFIVAGILERDTTLRRIDSALSSVSRL